MTPNRILSSTNGWPRRLFASLIGFAAVAPVAAQVSQPAEGYCTGRFGYALPQGFTRSVGERLIYLLNVSSEAIQPGEDTRNIFNRKRAKLMSGPHAGEVLEFDMPGLGPAAWLATSTALPEEVTVLAMKPLPAGHLLLLDTDLDVKKKDLAQKFIVEIANTYVPHTTDGFCVGTGAFVIRPSMNERALDSFTAANGVDIQVQTETVSQPDDGESSSGDLPPGGKRLLKQKRRVGGQKGIETRVQLAASDDGPHLIYMWIFAGAAADGGAPRIRLVASGEVAHAPELNAAWETLLASWTQRPLGMEVKKN